MYDIFLREWDAKIRIPDKIFDYKGEPVSLFFPFTTTLLEIRLNREPIPFQQDQPIKLVSIQASNQNIGIV